MCPGVKARKRAKSALMQEVNSNMFFRCIKVNTQKEGVGSGCCREENVGKRVVDSLRITHGNMCKTPSIALYDLV